MSVAIPFSISTHKNKKLWSDFFKWLMSIFPTKRDNPEEQTNAYYQCDDLEKEKIRQEMKNKIRKITDQVLMGI